MRVAGHRRARQVQAATVGVGRRGADRIGGNAMHLVGGRGRQLAVIGAGTEAKTQRQCDKPWLFVALFSIFTLQSCRAASARGDGNLGTLNKSEKMGRMAGV